MKIKNKIVLGIAASGTALALIPMFAAFEAHVINVTATIENALSVPVEAEGLTFGTVFPQEELDIPFDMTLSKSFIEENRVDQVSYTIRQKPKCALNEAGVAFNAGNTNPETELPQFGLVTEDDGTFICEDQVNYYILPLLCPFISKHETTTDGDGENDVQTGTPSATAPYVSNGINAFHGLP